MNPHSAWSVSFQAVILKPVLPSVRTNNQAEVKNLHSPNWASRNAHWLFMTCQHVDCPITLILKNPPQSQCKETEKFTFKTLEVNRNPQGDMWEQLSIYLQLLENSKKNLLPILLYPSWSWASGMWHQGSLKLEVLVFHKNGLNVSLFWLLLARRQLVLIGLQFLCSV